MLKAHFVVAIATLFVAGATHAGDGRLEINQACAATGCFVGDTAGFPVQTQAGQSYVLASSLTVPDVNTRAITLGDRAVLDLNGFEIAGPATCTGMPPACTGGTGDGVYAQDHSTIRNGTIRGMGHYGIAAKVGVTVESMLVKSNGATGIFMNYGSDGPEAHLIRGSRIVGNGGDGIFNAAGAGGIGSLITECTIVGNAGYGLSVSQTQLTNSTIARNGDEGLYGFGSTAFGNNTFLYNNGGNDQPQTAGAISIGTNFCGTDTICP